MCVLVGSLIFGGFFVGCSCGTGCIMFCTKNMLSFSTIYHKKVEKKVRTEQSAWPLLASFLVGWWVGCVRSFVFVSDRVCFIVCWFTYRSIRSFICCTNRVSEHKLAGSMNVCIDLHTYCHRHGTVGISVVVPPFEPHAVTKSTPSLSRTKFKLARLRSYV